jgi:integrase
MASITPVKNGFRVQVYVKGIRDSATKRTRREANLWGAAREHELETESQKRPDEKYSFRDLLERYAEEVSPSKRGGDKEAIRIQALLKSSLPINSPLHKVTPDDLGAWRDERLKVVKPGSVIRDFTLLSAIFETARREWRWIKVNPVSDVKRPPEPEHRQVVINWLQIKKMLRSLKYSPIKPVRSITQSCAVAFLIALRTGMRAGEICGLTWDRTHNGYCELRVTKTIAREVPLSDKAMRLINKMRGFDPDLVFGVSAQTLDALFRKARVRAGLEGFTFHDSRHTAATWLAPKLHILELCRMFGWKNTSQALVYFNPKARDIAKKLSVPGQFQ